MKLFTLSMEVISNIVVVVLLAVLQSYSGLWIDDVHLSVRPSVVHIRLTFERELNSKIGIFVISVVDPKYNKTEFLNEEQNSEVYTSLFSPHYSMALVWFLTT